MYSGKQVVGSATIGWLTDVLVDDVSEQTGLNFELFFLENF